jgi:hypothetical protein
VSAFWGIQRNVFLLKARPNFKFIASKIAGQTITRSDPRNGDFYVDFGEKRHLNAGRNMKFKLKVAIRNKNDAAKERRARTNGRVLMKVSAIGF